MLKGSIVEELKRKALHISMGLWMFYPLFLKRLPALGIVSFFLLLALFVLRPNVWGSAFEAISRSEDHAYGYLIGPLIYIFAIGICVVLYPLFISAASIGIMAFGDGFATLVGRKWGKVSNPIDKNKTIEGSIAFILFAFLATMSSMYFTAPFDNLQKIIIITFTGSLVGALVEMLPFENHRGTSLCQRVIIDDNFFVPIISGLFMHGLYYFLF